MCLHCGPSSRLFEEINPTANARASWFTAYGALRVQDLADLRQQAARRTFEEMLMGHKAVNLEELGALLSNQQRGGVEASPWTGGPSASLGQGLGLHGDASTSGLGPLAQPHSLAPRPPPSMPPGPNFNPLGTLSRSPELSAEPPLCLLSAKPGLALRIKVRSVPCKNFLWCAPALCKKLPWCAPALCKKLSSCAPALCRKFSSCAPALCKKFLGAHRAQKNPWCAPAFC